MCHGKLGVDISGLRNAREAGKERQSIVSALTTLARKNDEPMVRVRQIKGVLKDLDETLFAAARKGEDNCFILELLRPGGGHFNLKEVATDKGKLGNSPVYSRFWDILVEEGLTPFIKEISENEAFQGDQLNLNAGVYIFVHLP